MKDFSEALQPVYRKAYKIYEEILVQNVETGTIICHFLNGSPEYQDFEIKLDDCYQLFNIIKKQL